MGGFPSLKSADSIRLTKAEKRLGKKASEKFIDVRTGQKPFTKEKKSGSPKPNSKADTKSTKTDDRSGGKKQKIDKEKST